MEASGRVSGGASHKFNSIRHGRETAEITTSMIMCNALTKKQVYD